MRFLTSDALIAQSEDESGADFLRRRVAVAGIVVGMAFLAFLVFRAAQIIALHSYTYFLAPSFLLHAASALVFFSMALVLRFENLSITAVRGVETAGILAGSLTTILMGVYVPLVARPDFIILAALMIGLFARSVWVPSSARNTMLLGAAIGVPMVAAMYMRFLTIEPQAYILFTELSDPELTARDIAGATASALAVWWSLAVATAASASRVFYGLRKQVHDAKQLGQYKLERKLGEGGMGVVYRATHGMLRRPTAVKLMLPEKAGEESLKRFEREVQLTAKLSHPHTVTIFDYGRTPDGVFYYAMELLDGATLDEIIELQVGMPDARVVKILTQTTGALAEAHTKGLIHRDIKPSNIMLCHYGGQFDMVKVLDFGLVKQIDSGGDLGLTQADSLTGTPQYMSPEAITHADSVDARSDIYSLGCVAYYLMTGKHVFTGHNVVEVCGHHLHSEPIRPSDAAKRPFAPQLEALVLQCLAKNPDDRPANGGELHAILERLEVEDTWRDRDAAEWWDEYRSALEANGKHRGVTPELKTIDVDMQRRRAASDSREAYL